MTNEMIAAMNGINKLMFYSWNYDSFAFDLYGNTVYVPEVILKAEWTCNVEHMISKWLEATRNEDAHGYFSRFYANLDANNRIALMQWVLENYHDDISLGI